MSLEKDIPHAIALKQARRTSIILGAAAVITVIFMIYSFTQSIEAERQRIEAAKYREIKDIEITKVKNELTSLKEQLRKCETEGGKH